MIDVAFISHSTIFLVFHDNLSFIHFFNLNYSLPASYSFNFLHLVYLCTFGLASPCLPDRLREEREIETPRGG